MNRFFVRLYLLFALGAVGVGALTFVLMRAPQGDPWRGPLRHVHDFPQVAVQTLQADPNDTAALAERFGSPVRILPRAEILNHLPPEAEQRFLRGEAIDYFGRDGLRVAVTLPGGADAAVLGPVPPHDRHPAVYGIAGLLLLVALAGWASVRPLERDLRELEEGSKTFGDGAFHTRVRLKDGAPLERMGSAFNQMADQVEALINARQELLNAVSHELRTPLQRLEFAVELLPSGDPVALEQAVDDIRNDVHELDNVVADLLTWSRSQSTTTPLKAVDVAALVHNQAQNIRRLSPKLRVDVDVSEPLLAKVRPKQLHRAITNLCNNAARYADGHIRLTARGGHELVISVEDDGPGVPLERRTEIFEPFRRLDAARSRDTGGVGLGLAIAWRCAEAHGGVLEVDDSPLGGARFSWRTPLDRN